MPEDNERVEKTETSETTVEKPAVADPAEEKRVEVAPPVERTETTETTTVSPPENNES